MIHGINHFYILYGIKISLFNLLYQLMNGLIFPLFHILSPFISFINSVIFITSKSIGACYFSKQYGIIIKKLN